MAWEVVRGDVRVMSGVLAGHIGKVTRPAEWTRLWNRDTGKYQRWYRAYYVRFPGDVLEYKLPSTWLQHV